MSHRSLCNRLGIGLAVITTLTIAAPPAESAGDITVAVENGVLVIAGDREGNDIIVRELFGYYFIGGNDHDYLQRYRLWGLPPYWGFGQETTVNGVNEAIILEPAETAHITDIVIIGAGGDDFIVMRGLFGGDDSNVNIWIDGGAGRDRILSDTLRQTISGSLYINTGKDDDNVSLANLQVGGDVEIDTGHGADRVSVLDGDFLNDALINLGGSDDLLFVLNTVVDGDVLVEAGQGNDFVDTGLFGFGWFIQGAAVFSGGQGTDAIDLTGLVNDPSQPVIVGFELP